MPKYQILHFHFNFQKFEQEHVVDPRCDEMRGKNLVLYIKSSPFYVSANPKLMIFEQKNP
jgi:hypothetical protein